MASLSAEEVKAAKQVVRKAIANGEGGTITKKLLVAGVSKALKLEDGHFSKSQQKELANIATEILDEDEVAEEEKSSPIKAEPSSKKRPGKAAVSDSEEDDSEPAEPKQELRKKEKAAVPQKRKSETKGKGSSKTFRTAATITSDGEPADARMQSPDSESEARESGSDSEDARPAKKAKKAADQPPTKAKTKSAAAAKAPKGEKKAPAPKKAAGPLDSEEEELKKLKAFVVACGERKIWSKEFAKRDLTTVKAQQRWLRDLLHELGMPSRMSLQAAKEIGAKRALDKEARELGLSSFGVKDAAEQGEEEQPRRAKRAAAQRKPVQQQEIDFGSDDESQSEDEDEGTAEESDDDKGEKPAAKTKGRSKKGNADYEASGDEDDDGEGSSSESEFEGDDSD